MIKFRAFSMSVSSELTQVSHAFVEKIMIRYTRPQGDSHTARVKCCFGFLYQNVIFYHQRNYSVNFEKFYNGPHSTTIPTVAARESFNKI